MLGRFFIFGIRAYQLCISPILGKNCRFYPTCSHYALECFQNYSFLKACAKIGPRFGKCHPWHPGGIDLP